MSTSTKTLAIALLIFAPLAQAQRGVCYYGPSTTPGAPVPTIFARFSYSIAGEQNLTFKMTGTIGAIPGPYADCGALGGICMPDIIDWVYGMRLIPFIDFTLVRPPFPATYWGTFLSLGGFYYTPTLEERTGSGTGQKWKAQNYSAASCSIGKRFVTP